MHLFIFVRANAGAGAVDFNQPFQNAPVLCKEPRRFNCARPCGRKGKMLNSVFPEAAYQSLNVFVPDYVAQVNILVAAFDIAFLKLD